MSPPTKWLLRLAAFVSCVYVGAFLYVALARVSFGFDLEWMEGGMVSHAARLVLGLPIYAEPSADFVPFFYTPGYSALIAWLSPFFGGVSLTLARSISIVSTVGTMGLLFWVIRKESASTYAIIGTGIYAALFRTNGAFYDLARPDALYLFLVFIGVLTVYYAQRWQSVALAAVIFVLAFYTKQTSAVFVPPLMLFLFWRKWQHSVLFGCVAFGLATLIGYQLNESTNGWFWFYIFEGHQGHLFYWKNILLEYWRDLICLAPLVLILPLLWFGYRIPVVGFSLLLAAHWAYALFYRSSGYSDFPHMYYRELWYLEPHWQIFVPPIAIGLCALVYRVLNAQPMRVQAPGFWLLMFVAGAGASALNHSTQWAYSNCFMPISLFSACLIGHGLRDLCEPLDRGRPAAYLIPTAILIQFAALYYAPTDQIPNEEDMSALSRLENRLEEVDGKVLFLAHPLKAYEHNGDVHIHQMGLTDVQFAKKDNKNVRDFRTALRKGGWKAVVVDAYPYQDKKGRWHEIEELRAHRYFSGARYYIAEKFRYPDRHTFRMKTGHLVRPHVIYYAHDPEPRELSPGLSGNFEQGSTQGWQSVEGDAFKAKSTRVRAHKHKGYQGRYVLASGKKGMGRIRTQPFILFKPRMTYLMGVYRRGGGLRILRDDQVVMERRSPPTRRTLLRRGEMDLSEYVGHPISIEIFDDDPKGQIFVDDLRFTDP